MALVIDSLSISTLCFHMSHMPEITVKAVDSTDSYSNPFKKNKIKIRLKLNDFHDNGP